MGASITVEKFGHMPEVKFMLNKAMEMGGFTAYHPKGALKQLQLSTRPELAMPACVRGHDPDDYVRRGGVPEWGLTCWGPPPLVQVMDQHHIHCVPAAKADCIEVSLG
jgi:hypothetical protein